MLSSTSNVTNVTDESALSGGTISSDNGSEISSHGICWSTSSKPTIDDSITVDTTKLSIGLFECKLRNLTPNTTYYVRAYAINSNGTGYGNAVSFKTKSSPSLPEYEGTWSGVAIGVSTASMSGYGDDSEPIYETVNNIVITKISDAKLLIDGDTATVSNKDLIFKTQTVYKPTFGMNMSVKQSGHLFYDKIELYTNTTGSYSFMGINASISQTTTTTLTK